MRFDPTDVIESIEPGMVVGQRATCIQFVTVRGEDRNPGEICASDADSTILAWHDSRRSWQSTRYVMIHGGLEPAEFSYREGDSFSVTASVTFTLLDAEPVEALTAPSDWVHKTFCKTFQMPVPTSTPQPPAPGTANLPFIDVEVHAHITAQGSVTGGNDPQTGAPRP